MAPTTTQEFATGANVRCGICTRLMSDIPAVFAADTGEVHNLVAGTALLRCAESALKPTVERAEKNKRSVSL